MVAIVGWPSFSFAGTGTWTSSLSESVKSCVIVAGATDVLVIQLQHCSSCYDFLSSNNDWIPFTHDSNLIAIDSLPMTHLLQSSVSSTVLYCRAQSAYPSFRLFFSQLLSFTDCDTLCLTHYTYPFYYINHRITLYSVAIHLPLRSLNDLKPSILIKTWLIRTLDRPWRGTSTDIIYRPYREGTIEQNRTEQTDKSKTCRCDIGSNLCRNKRSKLLTPPAYPSFGANHWIIQGTASLDRRRNRDRDRETVALTRTRLERLSDSTWITCSISDPTRTPDPIRITVIENGTRIRNCCCCSSEQRNQDEHADSLHREKREIGRVLDWTRNVFGNECRHLQHRPMEDHICSFVHERRNSRIMETILLETDTRTDATMRLDGIQEHPHHILRRPRQTRWCDHQDGNRDNDRRDSRWIHWKIQDQRKWQRSHTGQTAYRMVHEGNKCSPPWQDSQPQKPSNNDCRLVHHSLETW